MERNKKKYGRGLNEIVCALILLEVEGDFNWTHNDVYREYKKKRF